MTKSNLRQTGFISAYRSTSQSIIKGKKLEAGADAEAMRGVPLTGLLLMASSTCFLTALRIQHSGLGPSTTITHHEHVPTGLLTGQSSGSIFTIEVPFSNMTPACVVLT